MIRAIKPLSRLAALMLPRLLKPLSRYFQTHAGKGVAGVLLADLLIGFPPALSWGVAAYLLWWACGHLRQSFRLAYADAAGRQPVTATAMADVSAEALAKGDSLDLATALDMGRRPAAVPAVIEA